MCFSPVSMISSVFPSIPIRSNTPLSPVAKTKLPSLSKFIAQMYVCLESPTSVTAPSGEIL